MIILPVLIFVFENLRQETGIENNRDKEWYISLDRAYGKRGVSFEDELLNEKKTSIKLAQEDMELPINDALSKLAYLYENDEDGDA